MKPKPLSVSRLIVPFIAAIVVTSLIVPSVEQ
jgi:hypothetical protein